MAIQTIKEKMTLKLELDGGIVAGKQKVDSKSFSQIKTTAVDEDLYNTATALSGLQEKNLLKVKKIETTDLISE
ncbi:DUF1659 domain-containing protein [Tissierella sp.]|uniref:DUF1659 domain-containing protein n=1 Tax=Tissierella sp. TaxID=41274 RepID=UPI002861B00F|nr:DUF1659 domain-containing protein [Tissierella sp.]MDR7857507.1 DUF1659 domain-containing protein [Tissierella sp.]